MLQTNDWGGEGVLIVRGETTGLDYVFTNTSASVNLPENLRKVLPPIDTPLPTSL